MMPARILQDTGGDISNDDDASQEGGQLVGSRVEFQNLTQHVWGNGMEGTVKDWVDGECVGGCVGSGWVGFLGVG